jgi:cytochrome c oxidase subunit 2
VTPGAEQPGAVDTPADALPPVEEVVPTEAAPAAGAAVACANVAAQDLVSAGQSVYGERCASCHGEQGEGVGDFPSLANNPTVTGGDVAGLIQAYFAVDAHPDLSAEELAGLFTYVRGSFGNTAAAVCPENITIPVP